MVQSGSPQAIPSFALSGRGFCSAIPLLLGLILASPAAAADLADAEKLFRTGKYDECAKLAAEALENGGWAERWRHLKIESELATGKTIEAMSSLDDAVRRFPTSIALRWLGRRVFLVNGRDEDAASELETIEKLILRNPQRYATPEGRLSLGRYFLARGADARKVLDQFYDVATKQEPDLVDAYLATAELALEKQDYALAATTLGKAPKAAATDPKYHYLLALAFSDDDRARSAKALADALKINPRHADSLLLEADHRIDAERYAEAADVLKQVLDVNPHEARAWAYRAVLAHLKTDTVGEAEARGKALLRWSSNPEVDHLIGRKLSQKYRFAEGSTYQRAALKLDADYLPAKIQLSQDLLRLGDETEGWKLAGEIFAKDGYNIVAYNLITLRDRLAGFKTQTGDGFILRMEAREAELYGPRVLALLGRAKKTLCETYGVTINEPVIVEVFPQKKDFAVRTFALPGADGLLGVCFGRVITANSPASQGESPSNWEAVLWHEFCHVVTLHKTHNKMPRWLSEGISVYEEGKQDSAWRSAINPKYRAMMLGDELTPLSQLSSAFLAPKTPLHLQFAYHESAVAVDFLVRKFGMSALKALLDDLGAGIAMNDALPDRTKMTLTQLDKEFAQFARKGAESVGPGLTWDEPELPAGADSAAVMKWLESHPKSFDGQRMLAARLVADGKYREAKAVLEPLKAAYPEYLGPENAYVLLATVYRRLSDTTGEHRILDELATRDGDAGPAFLRLMELDSAASNWAGVAKNARRFLAVNPLVPTPHRQLARAAEELGQRDEAVAEYRALSLLDDTDPAEIHFHLATLLKQSGKNDEARREVLKALEEAPRFRDAHKLLLELTGSDPQPKGRTR